MLIGCFPGSRLTGAAADDSSGSSCKGYSKKMEEIRESESDLILFEKPHKVKKTGLTSSGSELLEGNGSSHLIPPCLPFSTSLIRTFMALAAASCLANFLLPASAGGNRRPLIITWNLNL